MTHYSWNFDDENKKPVQDRSSSDKNPEIAMYASIVDEILRTQFQPR